MCLLCLTVVGGPSWRQRKLCFGAFVGLVVGCVGGVRTGMCAGFVLALSHGRLSKLTPVLKSPGVETMTGMIIAAGFIIAPTVQLMIVYLTSKPSRVLSSPFMHETQTQRGLVPHPKSHSSQALILSASASRFFCVGHLRYFSCVEWQGEQSCHPA